MAEFIQFAMVTPEDSYPVFWADAPIFDADGSELSCQVDHPNHLIEINPKVRKGKLDAELDYAIDLARRTYPLPPFRRVPVVGEVE